MLFVRFVSSALLLFASATSAKPYKRQGSNTNAQIAPIIDDLEVSVHQASPALLTIIANQTANNDDLQEQVDNLIDAFNKASQAFSGVSPSSGSNTTQPTNDELSTNLADATVVTTTTIVAVKNQAATASNVSQIIAPLDPAIAAAIANFTTILPAGKSLLHNLTEETHNWLVQLSFTRSSTALGF